MITRATNIIPLVYIINVCAWNGLTLEIDFPDSSDEVRMFIMVKTGSGDAKGTMELHSDGALWHLNYVPLMSEGNMRRIVDNCIENSLGIKLLRRSHKETHP